MTVEPQPLAPPYPRQYEADVLLRDGATVHVRPVRQDDSTAMRSFVERISPESIAFRFFGVPPTDWIVSFSLDVDYRDRFGLLAETGAPGQIIAHAVYVRAGDGRAEVAFLVADAWRGHGISTTLLAHLAEIAGRHGITTFTAEVLPSNHRMIEVFRESGFPIEMRSTPDAIHVEFPTSLSPEALTRFEQRDQLASAAAVRGVLEPRSVAVIGASGRRGTVGGELFHNLVGGAFQGPVYAVNPRAPVVLGTPAHRTVTDVPEPVDLAVVVVPAVHVTDVARQCAAAGVRALVVVSAGFAETGEEGALRQRELLAICRAAGMRLVGPNCLGVLNTAPGVHLNATFAPHEPVPGCVGFMSQSGGLGIAIIEAAARSGIGLSSFVSVGNKADLSGNDFLRYWEQDPGTALALLYLESFGNPRKFARIAPRFAAHKPLLAVKSGRSAAGARATSSHTGALLATSDVTVDALFRQAGVIRTDTLHELFTVGALLSNQPVPRGDRVAVITNAGGPGILCADACQADGVSVPELERHVQAKLREFLPPAASVINPIDMIATASPEDYRRTLQTVIDADACDAVLVIFVPPLLTQAREVAVAIREVARVRSEVPIAAVFMTAEGVPRELVDDEVRVPGYEFPEDAARAISLAARYGRWRTRPTGNIPALSGTDPARAASIISQALASDAEWLAPGHVNALLECYGLPLVAAKVVTGAHEAMLAAGELGLPVALKASAPGLLHKSDVGGVHLGLQSGAAVARAAAVMATSLRRAGYELDGLIVQRMAPGGVELIVGVVHDPSFGPVLACGAGGTAAELLKDVAVSITPLTDRDARDALRSLRTFPLLDGYRGSLRCDVGAVEDVLLRVSAMVEAHPEIVELDCNPVIATPEGAVIVDARVRVAIADTPPPMPSLAA